MGVVRKPGLRWACSARGPKRERPVSLRWSGKILISPEVKGFRPPARCQSVRHELHARPRSDALRLHREPADFSLYAFPRSSPSKAGTEGCGMRNSQTLPSLLKPATLT